MFRFTSSVPAPMNSRLIIRSQCKHLFFQWSYKVYKRFYSYHFFVVCFYFSSGETWETVLSHESDWEWHVFSRAAQEQHPSNNTFLWAVLYRLQKTVSTFAYLFHLSPFVEQMMRVFATCCKLRDAGRVCSIIRGVVQPQMKVLSSQSLSSEGGRAPGTFC